VPPAVRPSGACNMRELTENFEERLPLWEEARDGRAVTGADLEQVAL
jgi:hypothetical protein